VDDQVFRHIRTAMEPPSLRDWGAAAPHGPNMTGEHQATMDVRYGKCHQYTQPICIVLVQIPYNENLNNLTMIGAKLQAPIVRSVADHNPHDRHERERRKRIPRAASS
jgi:hypothetical protein